MKEALKLTEANVKRVQIIKSHFFVFYNTIKALDSLRRIGKCSMVGI
jgi:hypothetical protein